MIELAHVSKDYRMARGAVVNAVRDVSLRVAEGEFLILTGRSGSGKTTVLNMIAGLTHPTAGRVLFNGLPVWTQADRAQALLRNRQIGFVFQFPSLLPALTVLENVLLPATLFPHDEPRAALRDRATALLADVGLSDKHAALPRQLSAGQQQRVVVARALINRPALLLADEPTSDLDEQTEHEIMGLFAQIHAATGVTVVMVTHSTELTRYGTREVRMVAGQVAAV